MGSDEPNKVRRHSIAAEPVVIFDEKARAEAEARNGLAQFDLTRQIIEDGISKGDKFQIRPSLIQALHRVALQGISNFAGNWRPSTVKIEGSNHSPVDAFLVPEKIEELCDYLNENWQSKSAVHLASYAMWRLNWIHPFSDGNGRTSRALSYVVLCLKIGALIPGEKTIPDFIVDNRIPYFEALEDADQAFEGGGIDLSKMEKLMEALLAKQLLNVVNRATGN